MTAVYVPHRFSLSYQAELHMRRAARLEVSIAYAKFEIRNNVPHSARRLQVLEQELNEALELAIKYDR